MPLESLTSGTTNIRDLSLDHPEQQRIWFDTERDIRPEDWEAMRPWSRAQRLGHNWEGSMICIAEAECIKPGAHRILVATDREMEKIRQECERDIKSSEPWECYLASVIGARCFFPDASSRFALHPEIRLKLHKNLETFAECDHSAFAGLAARTRILYPDYFERHVSPLITDELHAMMEGALLGERRLGNLENTSFGELAMCMRIIAPQRPVPTISSEALLEIRDLMNAARGVRWGDFLTHAMQLHVLTAKDIRVTEQGLSVLSPSRALRDPAPLPAIRRFITTL